MADEILVNSEFTKDVFKSSFPHIQKVPKVLYPAIHTEKYDQPINQNDESIRILKT
jgi:alpha-1,3/alpha-1,6-mannosyltransferase